MIEFLWVYFFLSTGVILLLFFYSKNLVSSMKEKDQNGIVLMEELTKYRKFLDQVDKYELWFNDPVMKQVKKYTDEMKEFIISNITEIEIDQTEKTKK